jgi:hypothetical protein
MPQVPRSTQPGIAPAGTPGVRAPTDVNPDAVGTNTRIDTRGVQRAAADIYDRAIEHGNQIALLDADSHLSALETKVLYDPATGALSMRGKNAAQAPEQVNEQWTKGVGDIEGSLTNDVQRMAFRRAVTQREATLHEAVQRHVASETQKYDDETTQSYVDNERVAALANYQNPTRIQLSVDRQKAAISLYATRAGLPAERKEQLITDAVSKTQAGVIGRMLAKGDDLAASAYYKTVKDQIAGDDAGQVEKALDEGSVRGESQRQSDKIMATPGITRTAALAEAKKVTDPKVRDALETRINQSFNELDTSRREQNENDMLTATNIVDKTGSVYRIPPSMWNTFSLAERASLKEYAKQKAKGDPVETNWTTYYDLLSRASSQETASSFLTENLLKYRSQLGDTEFKQVTELQVAMRRGDDKADSKLAGIRQSQQIMAASLKQAGINPNPKPGTDDADRVSQFNRAVDEAGTSLRGAAQAEAQLRRAAGHRRQPADSRHDRRHRHARVLP